MHNTHSYHPHPSSAWITWVRSSFWTEQLPTQILTCGLRTQRERVFFMKWRECSKLLCKKSLPQSRKHTSRISATGRKIQSTTPCQTCWITSKTTTVSWCPTRSLSAKTPSRRKHTILETQSRPYFPLLKNFLSLPTSPEFCTHKTKPWISCMWFFTGWASWDWQFANVIAWQQSRGLGLVSKNIRTANQELWEKSNLTIEDASMHHANMVYSVVVGLN